MSKSSVQTEPNLVLQPHANKCYPQNLGPGSLAALGLAVLRRLSHVCCHVV